MSKDNHRRKGAYLADMLNQNTPMAKGLSGRWHVARPEPYRSFWCRLRQAFDVLRYRADAIYWPIDDDREEGSK